MRRRISQDDAISRFRQVCPTGTLIKVQKTRPVPGLLEIEIHAFLKGKWEPISALCALVLGQISRERIDGMVVMVVQDSGWLQEEYIVHDLGHHVYGEAGAFQYAM